MRADQKAGVRGAKVAARVKKAIVREAVAEAGRTGAPVDLDAARERVEGELAGKETPAANVALSMLKRQTDGVSLSTLEMCIRRDLEDSRKFDKAMGFVGVRIGLALQAGKTLVQHGMFEDWVSATFAGFSERQAQYYLKLGKVFLQENSGKMQLPEAKEMGALMVRSNDGSELHKTVMDFVGNLTFPELLDKYGIKAKMPKPGGFRPSVFMVAKYQGEHPELAGRPFEQWTEEEQAAFKEWQTKALEVPDSNDALRMAAEGKWQSLREGLMDHGMKRKTFAMLTRKQLEETRDLLHLVLKELTKALKGK